MSIEHPRAHAPRSVIRAVSIGLLYFAGAALAVRYTRFGGGAACLWVATAVLVAELLLRNRRDWPLPLACAALASACATTAFGIGVAGAPILATFAVGEAVLAAVLLRHYTGDRPDLGTLRGVLLFIGALGIAAPALTGIGAAAVISPLTGTPFLANATSWYVGHALGNITLTPIALLLLSGEMLSGVAALHWTRKVEGAALVALTLSVATLVFAQTHFPLLFLPLLPLTIAAFRFDRIGGALAIVILAVVCISLSLMGYGPVQLIAGAANERALFLQFYLAVAVVMTLLISAELDQRKALVVALRESEARYRLIADGSSDVILNLSVAGVIEYASPSIRELGGYDPASLCGSNARDLVLAADRAIVANAHRDAIANPHTTVTVEYRGVAIDGRMLWCETHTRGITDESGRVVGAVSAIRDISAHKSVQAELSRAAETDPLTGVINRRGFDAALDRRLREAGSDDRGVCAVLDLDFFKCVNDRFGHQTGDRVLCAFADLVRRSLRDGDLVARVGGEEFAVILWGLTLAQAHDVLERLRREVADLTVASSGVDTVRFTMSGGLAPIVGGRSPQQILHDADDALYRAKRAGRNRLELAD